MAFQDNPHVIRWRLNLRSPIEKVYRALATDAGRAAFWAETAVAANGIIHFEFPNGYTWDGKILKAQPPHTFAVQYIDQSIATFILKADGHGGTNLTLTDEGVAKQHRNEVIAGWVFVLLALKAAVDFGVDLRNHNPDHTWEIGFVEN
ncbi:SRPBCC family protein [Candidatus Leptofilum sp.]|uniref:SRPBCC family protein n=1 Tax=Candidatus Leptofilum sp. TaxID=3241576 RepID=UPI003B5ADBAE